MAILSDLLGFPHHTCARGSKVERGFLEDLVRALDGVDPEQVRRKEGLIVLAAELATGGPVDEAVLISSNGQGTVKNEALDVVIDALLAKGFPASLPGGVAARVAADLEEARRPDADAAFDALDLSDERKHSLRRTVDRPGQQRFRERVLSAYPGCAITGCLVAPVLDAAHIRPYRGTSTNSVRNGLCLRADLHRLWDRGLLAVHERTHTVLLDPQVTDTAYVALTGVSIALPENSKHWPDSTALRMQREWCALPA